MNSNPLETELLSVNDVLLTPSYGVLKSRSDALLKPFLYSAPMDTVTGKNLANAMVSLGEHPVICRYLRKEWLNSLEEFKNNENVFFAMGLRPEDIDEIRQVASKTFTAQNRSTIFSVAVDLAHGDSTQAIDLIDQLRELPFVGDIMSGSVCTPEGAIRCVEAGATHLRVGVGPGAACTTRLMTGCGVPQLSAIYQINKALCEYKLALPQEWCPDNIKIRNSITIIADGGIKYPGDAVKYLAAGADAIMLGRRFSDCAESAGWTNGTKRYQGQASATFQQNMFGVSHACPEGETSDSFKPTTTCKKVVEEFRGGLASAISYLGLTSINELNPENVQFLKITPSTYQEGTPHGV